MSKQWDIRVRAVVKMEGALRIILSDVMVDENSEVRLQATGAEELENKTLVGLKFGVVMPVDQLNRRGPGVKHADPFGLGFNRLSCVSLVLLKENI